MRFGRPKSTEPEINLIPFIDVLLVILIFLMLTTTYGRLTQLDMRLPKADSAAQDNRPDDIRVSISSDGQYVVQKTALAGSDIGSLTQAISSAASGNRDSLLVIAADARASHQAVMLVMEAAQNAGLQHITFSAQARTSNTVLP
jgi:biopolymer transport protein ExbD